jgi:RNA polymerase sigma factor (sigma-70 family)
MGRTGQRVTPLDASKPAARAVLAGETALGTRPSEADYYQRYSAAVRNAVAHTARRLRLSGAEAEDLESDLWIRLLSHRGVVERFRGGATLETYFSVIARNIALDARDKSLGKWRPTVAAKRRGVTAVQLERMVVRDNLPLDVAVDRLLETDKTLTRTELHALARVMKPRVRRRHVGPEPLDRCHSAEPSPYDCLAGRQTARRSVRVTAALSRALAQLSLTDRHLLVLRFGQQCTVAQIADLLSWPLKALYRRYDALLRTLRHSLHLAGVDRGAVKEVIGTDRFQFPSLLAAR